MPRSVSNPCHALAFAVAVLLAQYTTTASEPRATAGHWEQVGETDWLLRDPLTARPVALLEDPFGWLLTGGGQGVIDAAWTSNPAGLDVMKVEEVSPEYWAQPSIWNMVQRGPSNVFRIWQGGWPAGMGGTPGF